MYALWSSHVTQAHICIYNADIIIIKHPYIYTHLHPSPLYDSQLFISCLSEAIQNNYKHLISDMVRQHVVRAGSE